MAAKHLYILNPDHSVKLVDLRTWYAWMCEEKERDPWLQRRLVALTQVNSEIKVSTVFLGMDHNFLGGPPEIFETMVFGGPLADECVRYSTWAQAEQGHAVIVDRVQAAIERGADIVKDIIERAQGRDHPKGNNGGYPRPPKGREA